MELFVQIHCTFRSALDRKVFELFHDLLRSSKSNSVYLHKRRAIWDYQYVFSFDKLNGAMSSRHYVCIYPKYSGPPQVPNHSTSTKGISADTNFSNVYPDPGNEEKQNMEFTGFLSLTKRILGLL
jgi:hypothetical protein